MKSVGLFFVSCGMICALGCARDPEPRAAAPKPKAIEQIDLALAPTHGSNAIDREIAKLQQRAQAKPDFADHWILLGYAWVKKARQASDPGFYLNADACAEMALKQSPNYPLALGLRGMVLLNQHKFVEAKELARAALAKDDSNLIALGVLADAQLELGDAEGADDAADRMVTFKPNLPSYARIAHLKWLHGDFEGAKQVYRYAIDAGLGAKDREPACWVLTEAAKIFYLAGDYAGGEAGFDRCLQLLPEYPPALLGKAHAASSLGRFEEAARLAKKSFDESGLPEAAWLWGDALRAAGQDPEKAYAEVVRSGRTDARTLALFYATESRNIPEAVRLLEEELKTRGDTTTLDAYAWALYRAGRFAEAKAASDRAMRLGTKEPSMTYHAGAIAIAAGDVEGGLAKVKAALAMSPQFQQTGAQEARELVAKHQTLSAR